MTAFSDIISAVQAATSNRNEQATLYYACGAESGCQAVQNTAGAPAYGPWQIYGPAHPDVTIAQANDPTFAAQYIYNNRGVAAATAAQGDLWNTDPVQAAKNAAQIVEGGGDYTNQSQLTAGQTAMQQGLAAGVGGSGPSVPVLSGVSNAVGSAFSGLGTAANGVKNAAGGALKGACAVPGIAEICAAKSIGEAGVKLIGVIVQMFGNHTFWIRAILVVGGIAAVFIGLSGLAHMEMNQVSESPAGQAGMKAAVAA